MTPDDTRLCFRKPSPPPLAPAQEQHHNKGPSHGRPRAAGQVKGVRRAPFFVSDCVTPRNRSLQCKFDRRCSPARATFARAAGPADLRGSKALKITAPGTTRENKRRSKCLMFSPRFFFFFFFKLTAARTKRSFTLHVPTLQLYAM